MHHKLIAALGAATLAASGAAACSSHHATPAAQDTVRGSGIAVARTNDATVIVDGQQHKVDGQLACTTYETDNEVGIGIGTAPKDVLIAVTLGDKPTVKRVTLQSIIGDYNLFAVYPEHGDNTATATKNGKTYTITGKAWGVNNSGQELTVPFQVTVTCP
ncbi:lipoprotein LpqH [Mycobacterium sp. TY815]|uniref:lipoprotein LpqH n=1 Tax=Mycobacterium sp. TY815 TaxID=3050581 RepID=UPI0027407236|nr:lipoprotein LpqH [Mycobacterium sp. TY815]MDP7707430.1 lipoprotein LpqH [Mycobacterium sp. TY815]